MAYTALIWSGYNGYSPVVFMIPAAKQVKHFSIKSCIEIGLILDVSRAMRVRILFISFL